MIYIPDGAHILEKPWDRMISQQGNVDWFCFWLKGEEDPDPAKAEQYKRWHSLRARGCQGRREHQGSVIHTIRANGSSFIQVIGGNDAPMNGLR